MYWLEHLKVIQNLAADWKKMANLLELPIHVVDTIHKDTANIGVEHSCREMFCRWLEGEGCHDITWKKLIEALEDGERSTLAEELTGFISSDPHVVN